jgi:hypothetical protein
MCNDGSAGGGNSYCKMYSWTSVFIWEFFITAQYVGFQTCFTLILRIFHKVLFHFVSNVAQHETLFCIFLSFRKLLDVKWTSILCLDFFLEQVRRSGVGAPWAGQEGPWAGQEGPWTTPGSRPVASFSPFFTPTDSYWPKTIYVYICLISQSREGRPWNR